MERNAIPRLPELLSSIIGVGAIPALHIRSAGRAESSGLHVSIIVFRHRTYTGRTSEVAYLCPTGLAGAFRRRFLSTNAVIVQSLSAGSD
jgi:hypothetical protein